MKMKRVIFVLCVVAIVALIGWFITRMTERVPAASSTGPNTFSSVAATSIEKTAILPSAAAPQDKSDGKATVPENDPWGALWVTIFLAVAAAFLLAGLMALNQTPPPPRHSWLVVGGVIATLFVALILGSWHFSAEKPNVRSFLLAANLIGLCAVTLGLYYVPLFIRRMQAASAFVRITALLCIAGAAGGFAAHLANNEGNLALPVLTTIRKPISEATVSKTPTAEDKDKRIAEIVRPAFQLGFLGDVLIGMIAANALHLALATMIQYDQTNVESRRKMYFTLLALGILSGFTGSSALSKWAKGLDNASASAIQSIFDQQAAKEKKASTTSDATGPAVVTLAARLIRFEWPDENERTQLRAAAAKAKDTSKTLANLSADELIVMAASDFFDAADPRKKVANLDQDKSYLDVSCKLPEATKQQAWTARMLRVLVITCEGVASSRTTWYDEVQADLRSLSFGDNAGAPDQAAASTTLSIYAAISAEFAKPQKSRDWEAVQKRLELGNSGASKDAFDVARLIVAYAKESTVKAEAVPPDPAPIFRLLVRIGAVPSGFLRAIIENLPKNDKRRETLTALTDIAPNESPTPPSSPSPTSVNFSSPTPQNPMSPTPEGSPSPTPVSSP